MRNLYITYEEFERHLLDAKHVFELQNDISQAVRSYNETNKDLAELSFPSLVDNIVDLLAIATIDTTEMINYWVFELSFGSKYYDGCVKTYDGKTIKLKTIKDLWHYLISEV